MGFKKSGPFGLLLQKGKHNRHILKQRCKFIYILGSGLISIIFRMLSFPKCSPHILVS